VDAFRFAALSLPHPAGDDSDRAFFIVVHGPIPLGNVWVGEGILTAHAAFSHEEGLRNSAKPVTFFLALAKWRKKITCGFRMAAKPRLQCNICRAGVDGSWAC
jgi:hypothetical protein